MSTCIELLFPLNPSFENDVRLKEEYASSSSSSFPSSSTRVVLDLESYFSLNIISNTDFPNVIPNLPKQKE